MSTTFPGRTASVSGPAADVFPITPDDSTDLAKTTRAVYIGVTGNLTVVAASGAQATFTGVPGGTVLPLAIKRVLATGTDAGSLVGLI